MKHARIILILSALLLSLAGCSKKPGSDLLNMKFTKVYVGGWMVETPDKQKPLSEADRLEITGILNMPAWEFQKDFSISSFQPIISLYDAKGAKVAVADYQGKALIQHTDATGRKKEYYFTSGAILPVIRAFNAYIEPDLVVVDNDELPQALLNIWFVKAYVGDQKSATEDRWFDLSQDDSLYIRAMMDMGRWSEAKDLSGYAFETYYMLRGDGGWQLSVGVLAEQALVSVSNPSAGFARKVYYAPISVLGEVEQVLRRISPIVEVQIDEFINVNFLRAYIGFSMSEWEGKWFDLGENQATTMRSLLKISEWVVAHDLPAVGLDILYSLTGEGGFSFWITGWDEQRALVGVTVAEDEGYRQEFYYAPNDIITVGQNYLMQIRPLSKYPVLSEALLSVVLNERFTGVWAEDPDDFVEAWTPLTGEQSEALVFSLNFESWIVAENLPPMGLNPVFILRSDSGIRIFGTYFDGKSLFGVTNENVEGPGEYYFAPDWVVEFTQEYLDSLDS